MQAIYHYPKVKKLFHEYAHPKKAS
jgi:hypothetical protein